MSDEERGAALEHAVEAARRLARARGNLDAAVKSARRSGATWQQVGDAVGLTRHSAWRRWQKPVAP